MSWVLIISWLVSTPNPSDSRLALTTSAVTMQEFNHVEACKFASVEAQKIAPQIKVVCVPKGEKP